MSTRESNSHSFALTPHPCTNNAYHVCETDGCGGTYSEDRFAGDCDANGCDYNPYRVGDTTFYGKGKTVDTSQKFTVVTRFAQNNLTQFFVQNGKTILIPAPAYDGFPDSSSITPDYCAAEFDVFGDRDRFDEVGGFTKVNSALTSNPMVLVMSIWDDVCTRSNFPGLIGMHTDHLMISTMPTCSGSTPPTQSTRPAQRAPTAATAQPHPVFRPMSKPVFPTRKLLLPENSVNLGTQGTNRFYSQVIWSNIRFGPIGSTVKV